MLGVLDNIQVLSLRNVLPTRKNAGRRVASQQESNLTEFFGTNTENV